MLFTIIYSLISLFLTGELGIYIDFTDVTPCDKKEYGSLQYMNMDFMDKLYNSLSKVPFYIIKGALTKKGLTDGMILEKWHKGDTILNDNYRFLG